MRVYQHREYLHFFFFFLAIDLKVNNNWLIVRLHFTFLKVSLMFII